MTSYKLAKVLICHVSCSQINIIKFNNTVSPSPKVGLLFVVTRGSKVMGYQTTAHVFTLFFIRHRIWLIQPYYNRLHFHFLRHWVDVGYSTAMVKFLLSGSICQNDSVISRILPNKPYPVSNVFQRKSVNVGRKQSNIPGLSDCESQEILQQQSGKHCDSIKAVSICQEHNHKTFQVDIQLKLKLLWLTGRVPDSIHNSCHS